MKTIVKYFLLWKIYLLIIIVLSLLIVPLNNSFLGGGLINYLQKPHLWGFVNFDGQHYLSIVYKNYQPLTYFFFPLYPLIVNIFSQIFTDRSYISLMESGLMVSNISFFLALIGLNKIIQKDYGKDISKTAILSLILFPTSFYFSAFYTESLFFAFVVWSFYFATRGKWIRAGLLAGMAGATRIFGLAIIPSLIAEYFSKKPYREKPGKLLLGILIGLSGLGIYMLYLQLNTGDPLAFFHQISIYGEQRSQTPVLLPAVFFRYLFKILPSLQFSYFPVVFSTLLEISVATLFLVLLIYSYSSLRLSYFVFFLVSYLIPTFTGSFSSFPRYVIIIFPAFIVLALWINKQHKVFKILYYCLSLSLLAVSLSLFIRGFWIS